MTEDFGQTWRARVQESLRSIGPRLRSTVARSGGTFAYTVLATLVLAPVAQAIGAGDWASVIPALMAIAGDVGANLIAREVQGWHDNNVENYRRLHGLLQADPEFVAALDAVMNEFRIVPQAASALSEEDRRWLEDTLRREAGQLGSRITIEHSTINIATRDVLDLRNATLNIFVSEKPERGGWFRKYLSALVTEHGRLPGVIFDDIEDESRVRLWRVYTALDVWHTPMETEQRPRLERSAERRRRPVLAAANEHPHLVLLGKPGTGKTTFANFLALCMAGAMLGRKDDPSLDDLRQRLPEDAKDKGSVPELHLDTRLWTHDTLLPVSVRLRDFVASECFPRGDSKPSADCLLNFVHTGARAEQKLDDPFFESLVEFLTGYDGKGVLLVLDGLDEVPQVDESRKPLRRVVDMFAEAYPDCRILVTSRPYAYDQEQWQLSGFARAELAPLTPMQVRLFAWRWYRDIEPHDRALAEQRAQTLADAVLSDHRLRSLSEVPLLLAMMALVHRKDKGELPRGRALLYERVSQLLLSQWNQPKNESNLEEDLGLPLRNIRDVLERLAYEVHGAEQPGAEQAALIPKARLLDALDDERRRQNVQGTPIGDIADFLSLRSGILLPEGNSAFRFPHRSFQEFMAACCLTDELDVSTTLPKLVRDDPARWREVALLAAVRASGIWVAFRVLLENLCPGSPPGVADDRRWWGALIAGLAVVETGELQGIETAEAVRKWLAALLNAGALSVPDRAEAGRVINVLPGGDPRSGVGVRADELPDIAWVEVPGGTVTLEDEAGTYVVEPFKIAKYPVTYRQYRAFVDAPDGFHHDRWWEGLKRPQRPGEQRFKYDNHPAEDVSWYDAMAFCRWLSARLGYVVRLPREWEWQQAATGGDPANTYPWGPEYVSGYANIDETFGNVGPHYLQTTTAVGMYPQGATKQGVLNMAGNVWEWCLNEYEEPSNKSFDKGAIRVVRGGAWNDVEWLARCAYRYGDLPDFRNHDFGFRVVSASPI